MRLQCRLPWALLRCPREARWLLLRRLRLQRSSVVHQWQVIHDVAMHVLALLLFIHPHYYHVLNQTKVLQLLADESKRIQLDLHPPGYHGDLASVLPCP